MRSLRIIVTRSIVREPAYAEEVVADEFVTRKPGGHDRLRASGLLSIMSLVAVAGLAGMFGLGMAYRGQQLVNTQIEESMAALTGQNEQLGELLAGRDSLLATFLGPDMHAAALSATGQPPSVRLFWNTTTGNVLIAAFDLPPADAGRIYQLWGIPEGANPVSLGTFQTGADSTAVVSRPVPPGFDFELGAVTDEPAGGSPQPTTTPFLVGSWTDQQ